MSASEEQPRPRKQQRISQACDLCHRRSIRCRPSAENAQVQCQNCYDFAVDCTYKRPSRRRRNPSAAQPSPPNILPAQPQLPPPAVPTQLISPQNSDHRDAGPSNYPAANSFAAGPGPGPGTYTPASQNHADYTGAYATVRESRAPDVLGTAWRSFALASFDTIQHYLEIYLQVVYPIYPLFHGPTMRERVRKRHHIQDRGFFASVMAACALAAARARDGANGTRDGFDSSPEKSSEVFFAAAQDSIPKDLTTASGFDCLRACAILALTSVQYGQIKTMHQFFGHYTTMSAIQGFHDENQWPQNLGEIDKEERRRLFWAMYSFDIYSSVCFGSVTKVQEFHSNVQYPTEVNDEELSTGVPSPVDGNNWLRGWNFTTDMYRVLEHLVKRIRRNRESRADRVSMLTMVIEDGVSESQIMDNVLSLYYQLPSRFKDYSMPVLGNKAHDIYGFQAANIQATLQLLRMTLFTVNAVHDVNQKCNVAEQVLATFHGIAPEYLRAISTPLVYHLSSIGQILASVMEGLLCEESYHWVRSLLVSMADLLQGLESGLQPTAGASKGLRKQIDKIDRYMDAQRQLISSVGQPQHVVLAADRSVAAKSLPTGMMPQASLQNKMGMHSALDEFQLPPDLVNNGAWPWPFEMGNEDQSPMVHGFD